MKKLFIAILTALTLTAGSAVAQDVPFPDIPANHWALDAVAEIADLGIVIGFPDGTFRGNESFTRYQAALVVSRMLDVIQQRIDTVANMTQEDIASLRNALQELASDVASQGVRLSAAESAIASISDDVSANSARIDELEDRIANAQGIDPDVLRDLQNQLASQRVAIDTAQAQAEAAEARANEALDAANAAQAMALENASQIAAINSLLQLIGEDIDALQGQAGQPGDIAGLGDLRSQVSRNTNDIANIREFVILLRRDQVAVRDRVSALEASDAEQSAAISDLQARVTALEENPLGFTGTIDIDYFVVRVNPGFYSAFDIDRAYGQGLPRERTSEFSTGNLSSTQPDTEEQVADFTGNESGDVVVTPSLEFSWDSSFDGTGPLGVESFSAVITFAFDSGDIFADRDGDGTGEFGGSTDFWLTLSDLEVNYDPIGMDPLTFEYGEEIHEEFTAYVVNTDEVNHEDGFVLTVGSPDFLDFLSPTLTVLYTTNTNDSYLRGIRATVSPLEGFTLGFSGAQRATMAAEHEDLLDNNVTTTILGGDLSASIGFISLDAEYATSSTDGTDNGAILYAVVEVNPGEAGIPVLESLSFNYRDIDGDWFTALDGLNTADDERFDQDQAGFAVMGTLGLFILDVTGYYDQYVTGAGGGATSLGYGVDADADLPLGFTLNAFYHSAAFAGSTVDSLNSPLDANENFAGNGAATARDGNNYATEFGVGITHVGDADDALITGLDLAASYTQSEADFSKTTIEASASYDLTVSILTLTPYVSYTTVSDSDDPSATGQTQADDMTRIAAGTGLETQPLAIIFAPSLGANVNYRTTSYTDQATYTADLLQFSVGLTLNQFLFENSTLSVDYASWTGTNVAPASTPGAGLVDVDRGGTTASVSGYEVAWNYYGLMFAYGVYVEDEDVSDAAGAQAAQAFSISYTVSF